MGLLLVSRGGAQFKDTANFHGRKGPGGPLFWVAVAAFLERLEGHHVVHVSDMQRHAPRAFLKPKAPHHPERLEPHSSSKASIVLVAEKVGTPRLSLSEVAAPLL
jgi:hypothetical protein